MRFGSLFAGVGGFDLGLEAAGWECGFQVEWDPHCQQVLAHHWPDVPRWGDVQEVNGADLPPVDVITFGSPCQDLSVAGKRAGLEGNRSGLFFEATRIIKEMRNATGGAFPRYAIWENVAGALTSRNGDDFEAVLKEMAGLGPSFIEWAVLDAQFFGVPQRRRRVFVIACFDPAIAERSGTQILAVGEGRARNSAKGKQQGKDSAGTVADSAGTGGEWWDGGQVADAITTTSNEQRMPDKNRLQVVVEPTIFSHTQGLDAQPSTVASPTLQSNGAGMAVAVPRSRAIIGSDIVGPLAASDWKFPQQQQVHENKIVIQDDVVHETSPGAEPE